MPATEETPGRFPFQKEGESLIPTLPPPLPGATLPFGSVRGRNAMRFRIVRCVVFLSLVLTSVTWAAGPESTTTPPQTREGKIPFSPERGQPFPRRYPALDLGFGLCTFSPNLSDLSAVYGHTPSFGLNPMFSASVEIAFSRTFGVLGDAGSSLMAAESRAAQGTVGLVAHLPPFSSRQLRPFLGAGVALCSMSGNDSETITDAGATGWFGRAGVEYPLGPSAALDLYGGYYAYPRVSTDTYVAGQPTRISFDLSNVVVGLRYKRFAW